MKIKIIASLIGLAFAPSTFAADNIELDNITVKANRFERKDTETTYASEIHTTKELEVSGAATLYDYLAQQSSLNVTSNIGNKATPSINLRGYGSSNGNQNIVITLDGQRLNSIDGIPQLLGAIPLGNIERIEISKGSGSVIYGDGASAGAIQIYTKNKTGVTVSTSFGNYGSQNHYINAGISEKYFDLSASAAHDSYDGYSKVDTTGHKDDFRSDTQSVKLTIKPTDSLRLVGSATNSHNEIRYPNYLTKAQFDSDPSQSKVASPYFPQDLDTEQWKLGVEYDISSKLKISATHYREDKVSEYSSKTYFVNNSNEIAMSYNDEMLSMIAGLRELNGDRKGSSDVTSKDSQAFFLNTEYRPIWMAPALTISAGIRAEKIKFNYAPTAGSALNDKENLNSWDIGMNYRFTPELSVFSNLNKAFVSPNIDSFFVSDFSNFPIVTTTFNGFIKPQESKTFNIGLNHVTEKNRLKATLFYADLQNEFFLDKSVNIFGSNTNIDESHKYGLELQDNFKVTAKLNASVIYNYTRSIVDKELRQDGSLISNKDLPLAPNHSLLANLNYHFLDHANLNFNQVWRSSAYAADDFSNNFSQRQEHYETTNITLNYQYKNMQFFTSINNLFEHANSIQISDNVIYPLDFVRTWRVGMKADF